jgi:4'-phosphopantetheinyl transferase EntD
VRELFPANVAAAVAGHFESDAHRFPDELELSRRFVPRRGREFLAGRDCARHALAQLGSEPTPLGVRDDGSAAWPAGFIGAITHCRGFVAAVAARLSDYLGVGIDAEPAYRLRATRALARLACTPDERAALDDRPALPGIDWMLLTFCAKEAVYKAVTPTGAKPGFKDVRIDFASGENRYRAQLVEALLTKHPELAEIHGRFALVDDILIASAYVQR